MVAALQEHLNSALGRQFVELLIDLLEAQNVVVFVPFGAIKRAKFAIDVADVRVVHVAIDDIRDYLASAATIRVTLYRLTPEIGQRAKLLKRQIVKRAGIVLRNSRAV